MPISGVHSPASGGDLSSTDLLRIRAAGSKLTGFKFTTQDARGNHALVASMGIPMSNCLVRLFWDIGGVVTLPAPADFYSWFARGIQEALDDGIEWFEFLNEPNLELEWKWGITSFTTFAKQVIALIKQAHPKAKIISPGLSPSANVPQWDQAFADSGLYAMCDGIGAHAYGTQPAHLNDNNELRYYRRFIPRLTGTQKVWVTEASMKFYTISPYDVGKLYGEYIATLESNVQGAWFFVLQGDAFESSGESWASRPDIPRGLAEYVPTPLPPPTQYVYQHYHLDGGAAVANKTVEITMNAPHTIVGDYGRIISPVERFPLAYSTIPAGVGKVTVTPASTDGYYDAGTIVRVDFS